MWFQIIVILVVAALATVLVYMGLCRMLPSRWRASEVEASRHSPSTQ